MTDLSVGGEKSFNGAPDRNPGKDASSRASQASTHQVSMEPQIGIRGRAWAYFDMIQAIKEFQWSPR